MKKFALMVAVASVALLTSSQLASARRGGCGGGHGGHGGCGGCGMGGCGMMMGGCGMGGCGMGGCGMMMGGYGMHHHHGGYVMGGGGCPGGICSIGGGVAGLVQAAPNETTLIVNLPEDATLTIDGEATTSTSAQRVFVTPALEEGKEYEYTLKAKVIRDGETKIATVKVTFRPGETKQVELTVPATGVAAQ
ncbi:MAG TPA: TIGR03000 domain-containing protein [Gemmataceae bacterium]|nr:TIGR03000 domain-containing protein [Gemmataceae bacterium]